MSADGCLGTAARQPVTCVRSQMLLYFHQLNDAWVMNVEFGTNDVIAYEYFDRPLHLLVSLASPASPASPVSPASPASPASLALSPPLPPLPPEASPCGMLIQGASIFAWQLMWQSLIPTPPVCVQVRARLSLPGRACCLHLACVQRWQGVCAAASRPCAG